jgi:hypothetical protein
VGRTPHTLESAFNRAKLTRIVAETALAEYVAIYKQDVETVAGEISSADMKLRGAEESLGEAKRMPAEAQKALAAEIASVEQKATRAKVVLAHAQKKRRTLEETTKPQTIAELNTEIEKA